MAFVLIVFVFTMIVVAVARAAQGGGGPNQSVQAFDMLSARGVRARGLVLVASQLSTGVTMSMRRFERRQMTLDIEIPGRAPYTQSGAFLIPRGLVEAVPGASLELAIDPNNPANVVVLGPGGVTGPWLNLGPPRPY